MTCYSGGWATRLTAGDRRQCLLLFGGRTLIGNQANRPIAFAHDIRGMGNEREVEVIQRGRAILSLVNMEDHRNVTMALGWLGSQVTGDARAVLVATTRLEIVAADLPGYAAH